MRRKKHRQTRELTRKRARLKKETLRTARSAVGVTPLGTALTIHDVSIRGSKLITAARDYGSALIKQGKRKGKRIIRRLP